MEILPNLPVIPQNLAESTNSHQEPEDCNKPSESTPTKQKTGILATTIPMPLRMRVRSLFVVQGLKPAQISAKVKILTAKQVSDLANREGWITQRDAIEMQVSQEALAHTRKEVEKVVEAVGHLAEEGAVLGLERARDAATKRGKFASKDFANFAAGSRSLVAIARQARGLEDRNAANAGPSGVNVNLFFMDAPTGSPAKTERKVSPEPAQSAVDVVASAVP